MWWRVFARIAAAVIEKSRNLQSQDEGWLRWHHFGPSPVTDTTAGVRPLRQAAIEEAPRPGRGCQQCILVHSKKIKNLVNQAAQYYHTQANNVLSASSCFLNR